MFTTVVRSKKVSIVKIVLASVVLLLAMLTVYSALCEQVPRATVIRSGTSQILVEWGESSCPHGTTLDYLVVSNQSGDRISFIVSDPEDSDVEGLERAIEVSKARQKGAQLDAKAVPTTGLTPATLRRLLSDAEKEKVGFETLVSRLQSAPRKKGGE